MSASRTQCQACLSIVKAQPNLSKMRNLLLLAALALMPLVACNASGNENKAEAATEASTPGNNLPLDLTFLKNMGVDVEKIHDIEHKNENFDVADLNEEQIRKLLPMKAYMNADEFIQDHYIKGAKALAGGFTMLLYGIETGDDASNELLAIYDKDGKLTDYMQLGNYDAFIIGEADDEYTKGTAEATTTEITFPSPSEFVMDRTDKEGSWVREEEGGYSELTDLKWLVQTVKRYTVDNKGHMTLVEQKEVKREGNVPADDDSTFDDLYMLPMSTPDRIDRLNNAINDRIKKQGREAYLEDMPYMVGVVAGECYAGNPEGMLMWIYKNRNTPNMIVEHLKQAFVYGWLDKSMLNQVIEEMEDTPAQDYVYDLTREWKPGDE